MTATKYHSNLELLSRESNQPASYKLLTGIFCSLRLAWPKRVATKRGIKRRVGSESVSLGLQALLTGLCSETRGQVLRTSRGKDRRVHDEGGDNEAGASSLLLSGSNFHSSVTKHPRQPSFSALFLLVPPSRL